MAGTKKTGRWDVGKFADDDDDSDDDWKCKRGDNEEDKDGDEGDEDNDGQTISWILWKRANTMNKKSDTSVTVESGNIT